MKKTYQTPTLKEVKIGLLQMAASSIGYGDTTDAESGNLGHRQGFIWDDEEEDDEDF